MVQRASRREAIATVAVAIAGSGCLRPELTDQNGSSEAGDGEDGDGDVLTTSGESPDVTEQWSFRAAAGISVEPVLAGELLFTGSVDTRVYALDAATGEQQWSFEVGAEPQLVRVVDGDVFVTTQHELYGIDAASGTERFRADIEVNLSRPAVSDETVYAAGGSTLYALDRDDGSERWTFEGQSVLGNGVAKRDDSIITTDQGDVSTFPNDVSTVYGLDAETGEELWRTPIEADALISDIALSDGVATITGRYGLLAGFDIETGEVLWRRSVEKRGNGLNPPTAADGRVYASIGATVYALEAATGETVWTARGGGIDLEYLDGRVYVSPNGRLVLGYDAANGENVFEQSMEPRIEGRMPAITDSAIYYVDGGVRAVPRANEVES